MRIFGSRSVLLMSGHTVSLCVLWLVQRMQSWVYCIFSFLAISVCMSCRCTLRCPLVLSYADTKQTKLKAGVGARVLVTLCCDDDAPTSESERAEGTTSRTAKTKMKKWSWCLSTQRTKDSTWWGHNVLSVAIAAEPIDSLQRCQMLVVLFQAEHILPQLIADPFLIGPTLAHSKSLLLFYWPTLKWVCLAFSKKTIIVSLQKPLTKYSFYCPTAAVHALPNVIQWSDRTASCKPEHTYTHFCCPWSRVEEAKNGHEESRNDSGWTIWHQKVTSWVS